MEAVGAAASILTFVGAAAQCAKSLYETIHNTKNAPSQLASLASSVASLETVLRQLEAEIHKASATDLSSAGSLIQACHNDLKRYNRYAEAALAGQRGPRKLLKRIQIAFDEKEIKQFPLEVTRHVGVLGTQLDMLQLAASQRTASGMLQLQTAVADVLQKMDEASSLSRGKANELQKLLMEISAKMSNTMTSTSSCSSTQIDPDSLPQPEPAERSNGGCARAKSDNLMQAIARLSQLLHYDPQDLYDDEANNIIEALSSVLESLTSSTSGVDPLDIHHSTHADSIDIFTKKRRSSSADWEAANRKRRRTDVDLDGDITLRELKKMCSTIFSSHNIRVNGLSYRSTPLSRSKAVSTGTARRIVNNNLTAIMNRRTRKYGKWPGGQDQSAMEEAITKVIVMATGCDAPLAFTALLRRTSWSTGFSVQIPVLSVGSILPYSSKIFKVVESGDTATLKKMLSRREATLHDRDTDGFSLIFRSLNQPKMCQFFIDSGADIDEWVTSSHGTASPLSYTGFLSINTKREFNLLECKRRLILAGAQPSVKPNMTRGPVFGMSYNAPNDVDKVLLCGTTAGLQMYLDHASPFFDDALKPYALLPVAGRGDIGGRLEKLKLLIGRGSDVNERDRNGYTCLHRCIDRALLGTTASSEYECIVWLIEAGADVESVNDYSESITDDAYSFKHHSNFGGFLGDMWDAALIRCGYNIYHRRRKVPRRPLYGVSEASDVESEPSDDESEPSVDKSEPSVDESEPSVDESEPSVDESEPSVDDVYSRRDFERLWAGIESRCPYWDDPPWWPKEASEPL